MATRPWTVSAAEPRYGSNWASLDARPCPAWYLDAKFGIFIHWGVYSVPAWGAPRQYAEWYWQRMSDKKPDNVWWQFHKRNYGESFEYHQFAPQFRCELFDPEEWADLFHRSGARYVVPTSKHHDGFCLWPSEQADRAWGRPWNSVSTGPRRDLLGDLGAAVRKRGLKYGFYYSLYEWFNPLWKSDRKRYVDEHMIPQFKDVVTRYQPAIIFSDGEWEMPAPDWKSEELLAWLFNESPCKDEVVVDDRWGKDTRHKHGTYFTTEYGAGLKDAAHPWEENRGMGHSYGYNRAENIDDYKSARELILVLIDLVSRGGNFLLDIGPTGDGRIPVIMQDRLIQIGNWLKVNGEAIYGTRHAGRDCQWSEGKRTGQEYGEFNVKYSLLEQIGRKPKDGRAVKQIFFTRKPDALYAITPGWPGSKLVIRDIKVPADAHVTLLGYSGQLSPRSSGTTLEIDLPNLAGDDLPCLYAYTFKIAGAELRPEK
jgi:alpha-L-fucosidase